MSGTFEERFRESFVDVDARVRRLQPRPGHLRSQILWILVGTAFLLWLGGDRIEEGKTGGWLLVTLAAGHLVPGLLQVFTSWVEVGPEGFTTSSYNRARLWQWQAIESLEPHDGFRKGIRVRLVPHLRAERNRSRLAVLLRGEDPILYPAFWGFDRDDLLATLSAHHRRFAR